MMKSAKRCGGVPAGSPIGNLSFLLNYARLWVSRPSFAPFVSASTYSIVSWFGFDNSVEVNILFKVIRTTIIWIIGIFLYSMSIIFAQETEYLAPITGQLHIDKQELSIGESGLIILTLNNNSKNEISGVRVQIPNILVNHNIIESVPNTITAYNTVTGHYSISSNNLGNHNIIFLVTYTFEDSSLGAISQTLALSEVIEISSNFTIDWPDYVIPVLLGFIISLAATWVSDRHLRRREESEKTARAVGTTLALLRSANASIQHKENIKFDLWQDVILKENLYLFLDKFGREIGKPQFAEQLSELSIKLSDFNERYNNQQLGDKLVNDVKNAISDLISIINQNKGKWE